MHVHWLALFVWIWTHKNSKPTGQNKARRKMQRRNRPQITSFPCSKWMMMSSFPHLWIYAYWYIVHIVRWCLSFILGFCDTYAFWARDWMECIIGPSLGHTYKDLICMVLLSALTIFIMVDILHYTPEAGEPKRRNPNVRFFLLYFIFCMYIFCTGIFSFDFSAHKANENAEKRKWVSVYLFIYLSLTDL